MWNCRVCRRITCARFSKGLHWVQQRVALDSAKGCIGFSKGLHWVQQRIALGGFTKGFRRLKQRVALGCKDSAKGFAGSTKGSTEPNVTFCFEVEVHVQE